MFDNEIFNPMSADHWLMFNSDTVTTATHHSSSVGVVVLFVIVAVSIIVFEKNLNKK